MDAMKEEASRRVKKSPTDQPSVCSCVNLRRASRAITRVYDDALQPAGLKVTQYSVLANLSRAGAVSVSTLARMLRLDRTTLVRNLKALERAGLVEEAPSSDPRERGVSLSEAGRGAVTQARPRWQQAQQLIEERLGADGVRQLGALALALEELMGQDASVEESAESE
ncbi:MarR family winged helix-turn-helix transcriptional regulator [Geomonas sp. Red69]|uniref:MarR family winged helix-turn-helix transcriptional regulator n=1 Tax=Geomonas diazotrophica TaxID=2843197 RepID=UPI001C112430|nr:MarR family winged helix-turn-helix transcriptional regulator [Geomonas diazotrophica]MBU5638975.1 MarR family winged helix-turn-helix transcriptional regulator [Geomonas diazotrophica]